MKSFENPIQFDVLKWIYDVKIEYTNLMEICQGGPEVGKLYINDRRVEGSFGGPALSDGNYVYVPEYVKNFLRSGFRLTRISTKSLRIERLGRVKGLIFLDEIQDNKIFYFEDLEKSKKSSFDI